MTPAAHADPAHVVEDQSAAFALLADPATHRIDGAVARIDTHGAAVFLAGERAYKVKRAVRFPFMDFSTLERRRRACEAEVAINGPAAPGVYLGVSAIRRDAAGRLSLDGPGADVEYAVRMRRFDETATLDRVAAAGGLSPALVDDLVAAVLASHARAPRRDGGPATAALARYLDQNDEAFAEQPDLFPPERAALLSGRMRAELDRLRPLLLARGADGWVRRCHGDLHLRNVALIEGRPVLFDAIEFDDGIATGDVLYDLAFLLMDMVEKGHPGAANRALNRYLDASPAEMLDGLAALPLFMAIRAVIRAKVTAAALASLPPEARPAALPDVGRYVGLADTALEPRRPRLTAIGGLSGTGKSSLAALLAPDLGRTPGAVVLRSDVVRKRRAGIGETERLPPGAYTAESAALVYDDLRSRAAVVLAGGCDAVVDAVHLRPEERAAIEAVALRAGAGFAGLWLEAPAAALVERVSRRAGDASDATGPVVLVQAGRDPGPIGWTRIDASGTLDETVRAAREALGL